MTDAASTPAAAPAAAPATEPAAQAAPAAAPAAAAPAPDAAAAPTSTTPPAAAKPTPPRGFVKAVTLTDAEKAAQTAAQLNAARARAEAIRTSLMKTGSPHPTPVKQGPPKPAAEATATSPVTKPPPSPAATPEGQTAVTATGAPATVKPRFQMPPAKKAISNGMGRFTKVQGAWFIITPRGHRVAITAPATAKVLDQQLSSGVAPTPPKLKTPPRFVRKRS
jgi:hypothetical protein